MGSNNIIIREFQVQDFSSPDEHLSFYQNSATPAQKPGRGQGPFPEGFAAPRRTLGYTWINKTKARPRPGTEKLRLKSAEYLPRPFCLLTSPGVPTIGGLTNACKGREQRHDRRPNSRSPRQKWRGRADTSSAAGAFAVHSGKCGFPGWLGDPDQDQAV